jgi:hypothetical protein
MSGARAAMAMAMAMALVVALAGAAQAQEKTPSRTVAAALEQLELSNYEAVFTLLHPLVDGGIDTLAFRQERIEALRAYGIACVMTHRRVSAEGAFALLLHEDPTIRLDPTLVRPEAIDVLEIVRARFVVEPMAVPRR